MGDDRQSSGIIKIDPPLNWAEIREFNDEITKSKRHFAMALSLNSQIEHTAYGEIKTITSNMAENYGENAWGVEEFLLRLAKFAKTHTLSGEVIVIEPQSEQDFRGGNNKDAMRFTFVGGKLMRQYPIISWGNAEEYK